MTLARKLIRIGIACFIGGLLYSTNYGAETTKAPDIELVESIPVETILDNPDIRNTPEVWMEMIQGAKKTIDIGQFYICNDTTEVLEPIIKAVIGAGERGVMVRVIGDAGFYKTYPETLERLKSSKNISVRLIDYKKLAGGVMHAKYFIVDGEDVFEGSQNFDWKALKHIHELGVRIHNKQAGQIFSDVFELDWQLAEKNDPILLKDLLKAKTYPVPLTVGDSPETSIEFTPVFSPIGYLPDSTLWDEKFIVDLIDSAKKELVFQVLTYNPETRGGYFADLDNALRRAAARGVKVKMIVSDWSKRKPVIYHLKSLSVIPNIEVKMGTIPPYSGGFVSYARVEHCKYLVIDSQKCWVGSDNWERSYFYGTRNTGVVVNNSKFSNRLHDIFQKDWDGPYTYLVKPEVDYVAPKTSD